MKIIQKTKDLYKKYLFKFFEKNEKFNSFSTLEQSKYIANKIVLVITASSGIGLLILIFAKTDQIIIVQGELQPISRVREIKIPISGVVEKIFVQDGDYVDKKQRLLKLDDNLSKETSQNTIKKINLKNNELKFKNIEFKDAIKIIINEITNLKNVIEIEENSLKRFDFLLKEGALSKYDYDEQKIKIIDLKSKLISKKAFKNVRENQLKQQIKLIENDIINLKNELENVNEKLKYSYVTSPINGYIFDLKAKDKGFVLNPNTEIMRIDGANNRVGIMANGAPQRALQVGTHGSGNGEIAIGSSTSGFGSILFGDSASGAALYDGYLQYNHATQRMLIASNAMIGAVIHDGKMAAVGGSQYTPDVSFEVSGPLKIRNNTAGGISQTHTNMSVASSGKFIINFASIGTMTSGDTIVFTYNAVSWKSWFYKIRWSSTGGYMGELWAGGYNNNSNGYGIFNPKYRHTDHSGNVGTTTTDGATLTVTRSGQANTMTLTLNNTHVHPLFEIEYACGGGEGVPQASRASITVNS